MTTPPIVQVEGLLHDYGARRALSGVDFFVNPGEIFGLLGPNGGGKTTLFRILSTLMRPTAGRASILGFDVARNPREVRAGIGVVFQAPALDRKLTVRENLETHGILYGLGGRRLRQAADAMLARVGVRDRAQDLVETLSGGLMRRVEIAKGLLHHPRLLILDEPSTGLDPGARNDLWEQLRELREREGVTVLLTTHLMEEAERCDRVAILSRGALVACGTPRALRAEIGGDVLTIACADPERLRSEIEARFGQPASVVDGVIRIERPRAHEIVSAIVEEYPERIESITIGHPTLLDVFIRKTGHRFWGEAGR